MSRAITAALAGLPWLPPLQMPPPMIALQAATSVHHTIVSADRPSGGGGDADVMICELGPLPATPDKAVRGRE